MTPTCVLGPPSDPRPSALRAPTALELARPRSLPRALLAPSARWDLDRPSLALSRSRSRSRSRSLLRASRRRSCMAASSRGTAAATASRATTTRARTCTIQSSASTTSRAARCGRSAPLSRAHAHALLRSEDPLPLGARSALSSPCSVAAIDEPCMMCARAAAVCCCCLQIKSALNFDSTATVDKGCVLPVPGCLDPTARNFLNDSDVTVSDPSSCEYARPLGPPRTDRPAHHALRRLRAHTDERSATADRERSGPCARTAATGTMSSAAYSRAPPTITPPPTATTARASSRRRPRRATRPRRRARPRPAPSPSSPSSSRCAVPRSHTLTIRPLAQRAPF